MIGGMTEQQITTAPPDRAARARAARSLRSQQRQADRLTALGWTCTPPAPPPTPEQQATARWERDVAREMADVADGRLLVVGGGPGREHDAAWGVVAVDEDGFHPAGPGTVTLVGRHRPSDPVVVEVLVRVVEGQVP